MIEEAYARQRFAYWLDFMDLDEIIEARGGTVELQIGDFKDLPSEIEAPDDTSGVTLSYPSGKFLVLISDKCPGAKLDEVLVHELVHVAAFAQCKDPGDTREAMETTTQIAALLVLKLNDSHP